MSASNIAAPAILLFVCAAFAQTPLAEPKFEVASAHVIPADQSPPATVTYSGTRVVINGFALKYVIARAYRTETYLITAPEWTTQAKIAIQALMPEGATKEQLPEMLKDLLVQRFHLAAHITSLPEPVYALTTAKNGPKLNPPRDVDQATCGHWSDKRGFNDFQGCGSVRQLGDRKITTQVSLGDPVGPTRFEITSDGDVREEYLKATMHQLATRMSVPCDGSCLNLPVLDRTGIAGAWDFAIERNCSASGCDTYASALEKIGLKLEKTTAPVERLVIDQIDKLPTEN